MTAQQPAQTANRTYKITTTGGSLIAGDEYGDDQTALQRAQYWAQRRSVDVVVKNAQGQEIGRVSRSGESTPAAPIPGSTLDLQRQRAAQQEIPEVPLDIEVVQNSPQQSEQFRTADGNLGWQVYERTSGRVIYEFLRPTQQEAWQAAQEYLQDLGVPDASRFSCRPKMQD